MLRLYLKNKGGIYFLERLIGLRLANIRKQKHKTTSEIATGIISLSYLSNIEHCRKNPSLETVLDLSERLAIDAKILLLDEENLHTEALQTQYAEVFHQLILEDYQQAELLLTKIEQDYSLIEELPEMECVFYLLQGVILLKNWHFKRFEQIENDYLNTLKGIDLTLLSEQTRIYYFCLMGQKEILAMNYIQAVKNYREILQIPELPANIVLHTYLALGLTYIRLEDFETTIDSLEKAEQQLELVSQAEKMRQTQLYYLFGVAYYYIGFYIKSSDYLKRAKASLTKYPIARQLYELIILNWLKRAAEELKDTEEIDKINLEMFAVFSFKQGTDEGFSKNDLLTLSELYVDLGELGNLPKIEVLHEFFQTDREYPKEVQLYIDYGNALWAYNQGDFSVFEAGASKLLLKSERSTDSRFREKLRRFISRFYATNKKYKQSFDVLKSI